GLPGQCVNTSTDTITFNRHGLTTGDAVFYTTRGAGNVLPGLQDDTVYNVIVVDPNHLQFGDTFASGSVDAGAIPGGSAGVDSNRNMIRFTSPHHLHTGDPVVFSGPGGIGSLSGTLYVRVIDDFTIELYNSATDAEDAGLAVDPTSHIGSGQINLGNSFSSGEFVTYLAPQPLTFNAGAANRDPGDVKNADSSQHDIFIGPVVGHNDERADGLFTGEKVIYRTTSLNPVGGLTSGHAYCVIVVNDHVIRLANSYCEAAGCDPDGDDGPGDPGGDDIGVNPIPITTPAGSGGVQEIVPASIGGLTDGFTYKVDGSSDSSHVVLDHADGTGPISLSGTETITDGG